MKKNKEIKTNAMRILDDLDIVYETISYDVGDQFVSSIDAADKSNENIDDVYKTLATVSNENEIYIFVIPGAKSLDFKKAAAIVKVKSLVMLPLKDLKSRVGFERGATTSLSMKKDYPVIVDESAKKKEKIDISAGKIGHSIKINPYDLLKANKGIFSDVIK